jgi:HK97 family phage portal protein
MKPLWQRLVRWLLGKSVPPALTGNQWYGPSAIDSYRRQRAPTASELQAELKNTAWTCASINAAVCASFPPRLFVTTGTSDARPRCHTRALAPETLAWVRSAPHLAGHTHKAAIIEEVLDHPLLTLFKSVNGVHNSFDLWELTELYLEVHGSAYWLLDLERALGVPANIWILPSQNVTPRRRPDSPNLIDVYEYRARGSEEFPADRVIHFRFPDPRDPYTSGLSPLRACYEQVALTSDYAAMKRSIYDNTGMPSVMLMPEESVGEEERARLEEQWAQKFRRGGSGRVLVAETSFRVNVLSHSMGDLAALADMRATKEDIANAFHVPIPFLSGHTNLANMQAADYLHKALAITPRLRRRDEKLNEQLVRLYDPSGRLFLASADPTPANELLLLQQEQAHLKFGVRTINEIRGARGLPFVPWGDRPWLPANLQQAGEKPQEMPG